jgi:hypothetical protein
MGKHGSQYARVERDLYPTPDWVVGALVEHVDLCGLRIWESACGDGRMAEALKTHGASTYATDIAGDYAEELFDFCSPGFPKGLGVPDGIVTNPPFSRANSFVDMGLTRIASGGFLALLLPTDFDSAVGRRRFFHDCPFFCARIVLTKRIVWFARSDGERAQPKENHAWFIWQRPVMRGRLPIVRYAPVIEKGANYGRA